MFVEVYFTDVDEDCDFIEREADEDAWGRYSIDMSSVKSIDMLEELMIDTCNKMCVINNDMWNWQEKKWPSPIVVFIIYIYMRDRSIHCGLMNL